MGQVRGLWARVSSPEEAKRFGLHSLRVTGYNLAKRGSGEGLAVAQGMGAHAIRIINGIIDPASLEGLPAGLAAGNLHDDQDAQDAMMALAPPDRHRQLPFGGFGNMRLRNVWRRRW